MLLADVVAVSAQVGATASRKAKIGLFADLLGVAAPEERELVVHYLSGALRQRRTGVGWRSLSTLPSPADRAILTVGDVDAAFDDISALAGAGSQAARSKAVRDLFGRATSDEQQWLRAIATGAVRQGALDAVVQEALARAAQVPTAALRRAAMLAGSTPAVVDAAFAGEVALEQVGLQVLVADRSLT